MTSSSSQTASVACFIGDSVVLGTGDERQLGWVGRRQASMPHLTSYNLGVRGDATRDVAGRYSAECALRFKPVASSAVVLAVGMNDAVWHPNHGFKLEPAESLRYVRQIVYGALEKYTMFWVGIPPIEESITPPQPPGSRGWRVRNSDLAQLEALFAAAAAATGVPFLSIHAALLADSEYGLAMKAGDGVHPTAGAYERLAELFWKWPDFQSWANAGNWV